MRSCFTYRVGDPSAYGVVSVDANGRPSALAEKPKKPHLEPRGRPGFISMTERAVDFARSLQPSGRNELEITDLNRLYLEHGSLEPVHLGRGFVWFDAGTTHDLLLASQLVEIIQTRQRSGIAFPEEVAYRTKLIDFSSFAALVDAMPNCAYRNYLEALRRELSE